MNVFAFTAGIDQTFFTQHAKLLRQGRLMDAEFALQIADIAFAERQLAQDQQTVFVGQDLEQ